MHVGLCIIVHCSRHLHLVTVALGAVYEFSYLLTYTLCSKKMDHQTHGGNFVKMLTDFQNPFTVRLDDKFAVK